MNTPSQNMSYYVIPYQVLFHDTMAYGSHHHMTNFKFQNYARETMLFGSDTPGNLPWQEQLKDIVMLTREAYSFNLAPVNLGEKVGIVMSYEEPTRSTVRLCFRTIKQDGQPVNCGFQTMVLVDKHSGNLVPGPQVMTQFLDRSKPYCILEEEGASSFKEKVLRGAQKEIFTPQIINIARFVAGGSNGKSHPRILDKHMKEHSLPGNDTASGEHTGTLVFAFPGQGAYSYEVLKQVYDTFPGAADIFKQADTITQRLLGKPFLPLVLAENKGKHDRILAFYPDLNQIGIYLTEVLLAQQYFHKGLRPDLLLGHSFGEIAALAMSGVYDIVTGIEIVCYRVLALHRVHARGCMAAAYSDKQKVTSVLHSMRDHSLEVTVSNHPKQTVVSGTLQDIDRLTGILAKEGISLTKLDSAYPFHSSFLSEGVAPFRESLNKLTYQTPELPVYHCTENSFYHPGEDVADILATQFIKTLDFREILLRLKQQGYHTFVECGAGNIVTKVVQKNFQNNADIVAYASDNYGKTLLQSIDYNISAIRSGKKPQVITPAPLPPVRNSIAKANGIINTPLIPPKKTPVAVPSKPKPSTVVKKKPLDMPVAIVSVGCFLPAAENPEVFWNNIRHGVNGVKNLGEADPLSNVDFVAGSVEGTPNIVPDKTYALITGNISKEEIGYDESLLEKYYSREDFDTLTRGQRLLAVALAQLKSGLTYKTAKEIPVIIGSTADGSSEYDDATFLENILEMVEDLDINNPLKELFTKELEAITGYTYGESENLRQASVYREVVARIFGDHTYTYVVDSACSSSLYSLNLGVKSLLNHESDVVLAGGVFAPGPANNTLFAQFRGLTPSQSRPLDHKADGVVFSDGGCMVALKRLSDAMAQGDEILGVIRGVGLSSDGKSPSINVPQSKGQGIAIERAYEYAQVDPSSIQYIEAHATSTPVGDSVEFHSLKNYFEKNADHKIQLGSVKSLIGHTGWVSGVASVLKMCFAFKEATIPKQYNYEAPNPQIDLNNSPFEISTEEKSWPENKSGLPRRAGVNSFGFGGTNGHLIVEAYEPKYHKNLIKNLKDEPRPSENLVIVDLASLYPDDEQLEVTSFTGRKQFDRNKIRLPHKKMLLPDVVEHMDITQFLAPLAVEQILNKLPASWEDHKTEIGVVLGMMTKTDRGKEANQRVFLDRLNRLFKEKTWPEDVMPEDLERAMAALTDHVKANKMPSGPYTLPGLMPNVTSGRINNLFDFKGANFVIDMDENSLIQALESATQLLKYGDCKLVFSGAVNARKSAVKDEHEGALIVALTTEQFAREIGLPVKAYLTMDKVNASHHTDPSAPYFGAAQGIRQFISKLNGLPDASEVQEIVTNYPTARKANKISLWRRPLAVKKAEVVDKAKKGNNGFSFISQSEVYQGTSVLVPKEAQGSEFSLKGKKLLILTDQPDKLSMKSTKRVLAPYHYHVVSSGQQREGLPYIYISLQSEEEMKEGLVKLQNIDFDVILVLKSLGGYKADALLQGDFTKEQFQDLLFAVCKHQYERIASGQVAVGSLCLNALIGDDLNPYTGLVSGFLKSVIRELPDANIRIVNTSASSLAKGLSQLECELGQKTQDWEVTYKQKERNVFQYRSLQELAKPDTAFLDEHSVLLITGGGRGVTAVLAEKLLETYGCTVIALGRTSLEDVPAHILEMSIEDYKTYEPVFYKEQLSQDSTQKITTLKKLYWKYQAANELAQVVKACQSLKGSFQYLSTDINDKQAIDDIVHQLFADHGRLDMVVHGAGVQVSKLLPDKDFSDFKRIVSTKLLSLNHIYQACEKKRAGQKVHYHLLTSAFSYMGNDGQPDYGAANETMNRLAVCLNDEPNGVYWSSMAWLGWAGIGMTRGSEFAALAMRRNLRGITKEEGQHIFMGLVNGAPVAPANILLAEGEIDFYQVPLVNRPTPIPFPVKEKVFHHRITVNNTPILADHKINQIPTLPGAMVISMAGDAAKKLRPELHVTAFEDTRFLKFNRVFEDRGLDLRVACKVIEETGNSVRIRVRFMTDFYHKNGILLQENMTLTETFVRMGHAAPQPVLDPIGQNIQGVSYPDPYVMGESSNVSLAGHFDALKNIVVGKESRVAVYELSHAPLQDSALTYLIPNMIMVDAFWRFGTVQPLDENTLAVFVPEKCGEMKVFFDFTDFELDILKKPLTFVGHNPRIIGDQLEVGSIQVLDASGQVLLLVEKGVCRKFDEIVINEEVLTP